MKFLRFFRVFAVFVGLSAMVLAANPPASPAPAALLPAGFGGWELQGTLKTSSDPNAADPANATVLKEYRFSDLAAGTYTRDDGRTLKIRAARFSDASGAFGAYTFYLRRDMTKQQIGDQSAAQGDRVLFYRGNVVVDAQFSKETPMSAAELRELAGDLPRTAGSAANLPSFISFLPQRDYIANTQKYVMGPVALSILSSAVTADLVDFGASSEVSFANYQTPSGEATLILIAYPTPQLAAEHRRRINAARQMPEARSGESTIICSGDFCDKRTGPIIAIAVGGISDSDAKTLLGRVNYEANVTWNTPSENSEVRDLYKLILNIVVLCGILAGLAIIAGVAFGGIRILMKRLYPDRVFDRPEQVELICLHLTETVVRRISQDGSDEAQNPS